MTLLSEPLLSQDDVAAFFSVPAATLATWRAQRRGPRFFRIGVHVRYARKDVEAWLEEQANRSKFA